MNESIDIFIEEMDKKNVKVYFVQIGCIYKCNKDNIYTLCDNVVNMFVNFNMFKYGVIRYHYLPLNIYSKFYNSETETLLEKKVSQNINYIVKKVC